MSGSKQSTRRRENAVTMDPRAVATRQRIVSALEDLLQQGVSPSVASLCKHAGVGRSTFYIHFLAVEDVVVLVIDDVIEDINRRDIRRRNNSIEPRSVTARDGTVELLRALTDKSDFLLGPSAAVAQGRLHQHLRDRIASSIDNVIRVEQPHLPACTLRTTSDFLAGGILSAILSWLAAPEGRTEDHLVSTLLTLFPQWLAGDVLSEIPNPY